MGELRHGPAPSASSWRMLPSRPRASRRSRASACDRRGGRTLASTSKRTDRRGVHPHDAADAVGEHVGVRRRATRRTGEKPTRARLSTSEDIGANRLMRLNHARLRCASKR